MTAAFIYTDTYLDYDYGPTHPLQVIRLKLTYDLIKAYGLLDLPSVQFVSTVKAEEKDLASYHSEEYLNILRQADKGHLSGNAFSYGLGPGDNPIFRGLYSWSLLTTGATLQAVDFVAEGKGEIAFNIAGGLHHAMRARASGFCYINDPVIGIMKLVKSGKRVAYIDIDAHHGDGVQKAFYETNQVLTISLHETGYTLFPGTGFEHEIGKGEGEGYSVNLPFPPGTDDEVFSWAFEEVVPELVQAFKPDVVVTQLGVDTFYNDPLTNLHLSIPGYERVLRKMKDLAPRWVALGGGGYNISNVARAWTLAWAVMNGVELNEKLPESFLKEAVKIGFEGRDLKGDLRPPLSNQNKESQMEMQRVVRYIKGTVLPKVKGKSCGPP
ncbi:MAG: acetoin utilization protein AcuC [bacterium]